VLAQPVSCAVEPAVFAGSRSGSVILFISKAYRTRAATESPAA
jgi:hypothetical protein